MARYALSQRIAAAAAAADAIEQAKIDRCLPCFARRPGTPLLFEHQLRDGGAQHGGRRLVDWLRNRGRPRPSLPAAPACRRDLDYLSGFALVGLGTQLALERAARSMADPATSLSIGQVAERTGLSAHTLRFYEREDILANARTAEAWVQASSLLVERRSRRRSLCPLGAGMDQHRPGWGASSHTKPTLLRTPRPLG